MSKIIKITSDHLDEICRDFEKSLREAKVADGKISFTKTLGLVNRKATVYFSEIAWLKMQTLIREFDKEVAWHGIATRGEDTTKDEYYINDILVYPQEVTGATVNTDQEKYEMWLMQHDDDVFNNIRMQGHSHVNMGTSPSSVDLTHQEKILEQLEDDMFYIFMIWNKRGEKNVKIYDLAKNVLFDGNDVTVKVSGDSIGISKFLTEAKEMVKNKPFISASTSYGNYTYGNYTYGSGNNSYADKDNLRVQNTSGTIMQSKSGLPTAQQDPKQKAAPNGKKGKRKGKRKKM